MASREPSVQPHPGHIDKLDRPDARHRNYPNISHTLSRPRPADDDDEYGYQSDRRRGRSSRRSSSRARHNLPSHHDEISGSHHSAGVSASHPTTPHHTGPSQPSHQPIKDNEMVHHASSRSSSAVSTSRSSIFSAAPYPSSVSSYTSDNHSRFSAEREGERKPRHSSQSGPADRPLLPPPPPPPTVRGGSQPHSRGRGRSRPGDQRNDGYYPPNAWDNNSKTKRRLRKAERDGHSRSRSDSRSSSRQGRGERGLASRASVVVV
ncbi:hypothetical protein MFIFM68171_08414 [Madurella fahalii]|uniref:Transformer n=1 Tax=Madurella fahalii TaxID=1157608 RepID=A0ABQ0GKC2_9PEZI